MSTVWVAGRALTYMWLEFQKQGERLGRSNIRRELVKSFQNRWKEPDHEFGKLCEPLERQTE